MPFRPPSPSDGPLAKVDCLAEKDPVTVREDHLADVELVAVAVSDPQKVRYGGLAEKEGVDEGSRVGRLRRTTEAALVKTWSYELAATTRYKGVGEAMRVEGGGLRRTVEDFQWCRLALVAEHPGVVVPPLGVEAQAGDADAPARWLMLLLEHPQLKSNDALKVFCLGSPSEFAAAQRDHVPFKDPTPLAVHLGALYIKGRETLSRERKQVIEEDAQEEKDEKRRKAGGHLSSAEIRAFAKWLDEEAAAVSAAAKASAAAVAADAAACAEQKLALASVAALAGSAGSADDAAPPRFGPARALPELNDMVGYLGAAHDAIYGRDVARRTLAAAKARLVKIEAAAAKAKEYADVQAAREAARKCDEAAKAVAEAQAAREAAEKLEADAQNAESRRGRGGGGGRGRPRKSGGREGRGRGGRGRAGAGARRRRPWSRRPPRRRPRPTRPRPRPTPRRRRRPASRCGRPSSSTRRSWAASGSTCWARPRTSPGGASRPSGRAAATWARRR